LNTSEGLILGDTMKKMVEIYSSGNEYYYYLDGKKRGGFASKEKAKADAKEMNRARKERGKNKVATSKMPKREDRFRQMGDTRLYKPRDRRLRIKKSEWFSILKNRRRFNVKKPDKKKEENKYALPNYSAQMKEAEKRRKELSSQGDKANRKRKAKENFNEISAKLSEMKRNLSREADKILKDNEDSLEKTEKAIEDFIDENILRYARMKNYLNHLYGYAYGDKDIDELIFRGGRKAFSSKEQADKDLSGFALSKKSKDFYRKELKRLFEKYACRDCGSGFAHKNDWPCKVCGFSEPEGWTRIR
jgi:hypothetical protein